MADRRNAVGRRSEDVIRDFYPWRIRLWNESSRAAVLTLAARGAVRELYDELWLRSGRIQNDDRILWRLSKANCIEEWQGVKDEVMTMFEISEDGQWLTSQRITEEITKAVQVLENRRKGWNERKKKSDSSHPEVRIKSRNIDIRQKTEDKEESKALPPNGGIIRARQMPQGFEPKESHRIMATNLGVELAEEFVAFSDFHQSKGSRFIDWDKAFNTWLRNGRKFARSKANGRQSAFERVADEVRETD